MHDFIGGTYDTAKPHSLLLAENKTLYGSGNGLRGAIFRMDTDGENYKIIQKEVYGYHLQTVAKDGTIYGVESRNVQYGIEGGSLFRLNTDDSVETIYKKGTSHNNKDQTDNYGIGSFIDGKDGYFYAVNGKHILRVTYDAQNIKILHEFTGPPLDPRGTRRPPIIVGDWLYGIAESSKNDNKSTLYRIKKDGSNYKLLHGFKENMTKLVADDDVLHLMGYKAIYRLENEQLIKQEDFVAYDSGHLAMSTDGALYATNKQGVFRINLETVEMPTLQYDNIAFATQKPWPVKSISLEDNTQYLAALSPASDSDNTLATQNTNQQQSNSADDKKESEKKKKEDDVEKTLKNIGKGLKKFF